MPELSGACEGAMPGADRGAWPDVELIPVHGRSGAAAHGVLPARVPLTVVTIVAVAAVLAIRDRLCTGEV